MYFCEFNFKSLRICRAQMQKTNGSYPDDRRRNHIILPGISVGIEDTMVGNHPLSSRKITVYNGKIIRNIIGDDVVGYVKNVAGSSEWFQMDVTEADRSE